MATTIKSTALDFSKQTKLENEIHEAELGAGGTVRTQGPTSGKCIIFGPGGLQQHCGIPCRGDDDCAVDGCGGTCMGKL